MKLLKTLLLLIFSLGYLVEAQAENYVLELAVDADSRWYARHGTASADEIAHILSQVNEIFQKQLGIEIRIKRQNIFTDPLTDPYFSAVLPTDLLEAFRSTVNVDGHLGLADAYHLFSADRPGFAGLTGWSYIGVACQSNGYNFGYSHISGYADYAAILVAHELGHTLGAKHDTTEPGSIMNESPQKYFVNPNFSAQSVQEIKAYISQGGSCLIGSSDAGSLQPRLPNDVPSSAPFPTTPSGNPAFDLSVSYSNKSGKFSAQVSLLDESAQSCQQSVVLSDTSIMSAGSEVTLYNGDASDTRISSKGGGLIKGSTKTKTSIYVNAKLSCPGNQILFQSAKLKPYSKSGKLSRTKWMKTIAKKAKISH